MIVWTSQTFSLRSWWKSFPGTCFSLRGCGPRSGYIAAYCISMSRTKSAYRRSPVIW